MRYLSSSYILSPERTSLPGAASVFDPLGPRAAVSCNVMRCDGQVESDQAKALRFKVGDYDCSGKMSWSD